MASSYTDDDKVIKEKEEICTLREDKRHRKTCAEGYLGMKTYSVNSFSHDFDNDNNTDHNSN